MAGAYEGIKHIVHIGNRTKRCDLCMKKLRADELQEGVNHYLNEHGYKLLHVGTETISDARGDKYHTTVAIVGWRDSPDDMPPALNERNP